MSWMIARRLAHARKRHYTFAGRTVSSLNANQSRPGRSSSENNDLPAVCESFARSHAALVRGEAFCSLRLSVRTPPFHGGESGSIPLGSASGQGAADLSPQSPAKLDLAAEALPLDALAPIDGWPRYDVYLEFVTGPCPEKLCGVLHL